MRQLFRTFGVAILVAASLNATAGLCFCHRLRSAAGSAPASRGCCHSAGTQSTTALRALGSCCHIETAQREMTVGDAVQVAQPTASVIHHLSPADEALPFHSFALAFAPSPPIRVLRL